MKLQGSCTFVAISNPFQIPEKTLLGLIAKDGSLRTGELYKSFREVTGLEYTRFYEIIEENAYFKAY
ncbi:MAG: hypothetical protein R2741_06840 [Methanolobus sp.]